MLAAIAAMDENRVIGKANQLPWHLPADLKHFKEITSGHTILMGRKTYESIGRPLPNRRNIVMTRDAHYQAPGCEVVTSLQAALDLTMPDEQIFIIGGAEIYHQTLPQVQRLYLTIIHDEFVGDTYFPDLDKQAWQELSKEKHEPDEKNAHAYTFLTLERKT